MAITAIIETQNKLIHSAMNHLHKFIHQINTTPETIEFDDVIDIIDRYYNYTPRRFVNGTDSEHITNAAGENEGSCKIFSLAKILQLNKLQTLHCFGRYYRDEVLKNPENSDHGNIRTFIKYGWQHVVFEENALTAKTDS